MKSVETKYEGYYQNVDSETDAITQLHFLRSGEFILVNAWGRCHPDDCEWGETKLHLLEWSRNNVHKNQAFASWKSSHCHFIPTEHGISCSWFSVHNQPEMQGFRIDLDFMPGQSERILQADPLYDYRKMWDGSESGWKLVRFTQPVYVVEFHFDESGPTREEFETIKEFSTNHTGGDENQWWESLRDISGNGIAQPIVADRLKLLHSHQLQNHLDLTIRTITTDDYLFLSPNGNYATWLVHRDDHNAVVKKMLDSNVQIETRSVP